MNNTHIAGAEVGWRAGGAPLPQPAATVRRVPNCIARGEVANSRVAARAAPIMMSAASRTQEQVEGA
jgi:hypothetical protein